MRTCVGCRRRAASEDLIRVVPAAGAGWAVDVGGGRGGRGAYFCPSLGCVGRAVTGGLTRSWRRPARLPDARAVAEEVVAALGREVTRLVAQGLRDGRARRTELERSTQGDDLVLTVGTAEVVVLERGLWRRLCRLVEQERRMQAELAREPTRRR